MSGEEFEITCEGPGPHAGDGSGVLGTADREVHGFYCTSEACIAQAEVAASQELPVDQSSAP